MLEALAIREALSLADDLYARRIHVASDCKVVVNDLHQGKFAAYGAVLREISDCSSIFLSCNIGHEFRSSNYEAHDLEKHSLSLAVGRDVWLGQPGDLPCVPVNIVTG
uniref:RNase H type-1 domain-containing protein n=1 Tax=Aegilops tauschii subsp. strangulata TaxID=200361 RepID=A0A453D7X7_AEGTS